MPAAGNLLLMGVKLHWGLDPKVNWVSRGAFLHSPLSTRGFLRADPGRNAECHLGIPPTHPRGRQRTRVALLPPATLDPMCMWG